MYPLLTRLKNAGLLGYKWKESKSGPPRKYYHLTEEGTTFLTELLNTWNQLLNVVNQSTKKPCRQMKKTQNVNIGGYPFTIDQDAFHQLEDYLDRIEDHFRNSEGFEEIIDDIERRMAELLQDRVKSKSIVSSEDVAHAISVLGTPEDFGTYEEGSAGPRRERSGGDYKTGKRLYRDPDDRIIGGVCSGLAAYFGIQDPIWVRVGFVLASLGAGSGVMLYLVLWALVPEAKTPRDFLSMRGEPINVNNIAKVVEEQVEQITDHLSDLGNDWKSRRRKKKSGKPDESLGRITTEIGLPTLD